jgi:membrane protein
MDEKAREDKLFFLAGGVAFSLILAFIPLLVTTITATAFFLGGSGEQSVEQIVDFIANVIPVSAEAERVLPALLHDTLTDVLPTASTTASIGTIAFILLTTRLFGSLRIVLADVFDIEETRNPIAAKLFDMRMSLVSSLFLMSYFAIRTYVALAVRGQLVGELEAWLFTLLAYVFILLTFFLLYRYLPRKRVRARTALVASIFTAVMFEAARYLFGQVMTVLNPGSVYSGVIAAAIVGIVWSYYVALVFILGGEVGQVYDLLRTRRLQRVVFE